MPPYKNNLNVNLLKIHDKWKDKLVCEKSILKNVEKLWINSKD